MLIINNHHGHKWLLLIYVLIALTSCNQNISNVDNTTDINYSDSIKQLHNIIDSLKHRIQEYQVNPSVSTITKVEKPNGLLRTFYMQNGKVFIHDEQQVEEKDIELKIPDGKDGVIERLHYTTYFKVYNDQHILYIISSSGGCGAGFLWENNIFKVDMFTLKTEYVVSCASVEFNENSFTTAQGRITDETKDLCTYQYDYRFHEETYNVEGMLIKVSHHEYESIDDVIYPERVVSYTNYISYND